MLVGDKGRDQVCSYRLVLVFWAEVTGLDCESTFPALTSESICPAFCSLVLQEGFGLHYVRPTPPVSTMF